MENIHSFSSLSEAKYKVLCEAPALITILVAGADGKIDEQELNWAEKLTHIRSYAEPESLNSYYETVEHDFIETYQNFLEDLPDDQKEREQIIKEKLIRINDILASLPNPIAYRVYVSLLSFAKHIAKASGGFLRFGSISREEKKWISLDMIHPIILEEEEEIIEDVESDD